MRTAFIVIFCVLCASARADDEAGAALLKIDGKKVYDIAPFLKKYVQGNNTITAQRAFLFFNAGKFRNIPNVRSAYIDDGLENRKTWYALSLRNTTSHRTTLMLEFILSGINAVACFRMGDNREIYSVATTAVNPENENKFSVLARPEVINIDLRAGEQTTILFCTINNGQLLYTNLQLYELSHFTQLDCRKHNMLGMFQGVFFFIIIFNLLIFITTADSIYFYYALYAFLIGIFALNDAGAANFGLFYLPVLGYFSGLTFLFAGFAVWLLLMLKFLSLGKNHRLLYRTTIAIVAVDLVLAFLPLCLTPWKINTLTSFQHAYQLSLMFVFIINIVFIIIVNLARVAKGNKLALFYTIANIPVVLGAVIYFAHYYNLTHLSNATFSPIALGLIMETFLISLGFAYRYNLMQKEKQKLLTGIYTQQQESARKIIDVQEAEQKRIARDLHDELGGNLAALKMTVESAGLPPNETTLVTNLIDITAQSVRNIAHNIMPPEFDKTELATLLNNYFQQLNRKGIIHFSFCSTGVNILLDKQRELMIYRVIMELTSNIIKHSGASEATIQMVCYENHLEVMVEDNGKGFDTKAVTGSGLKNIHSRVSYMKGEIAIDSGKSGTTTIIKIPV